ncbi:MAG: helix-turn-helix domain-containing protein [Acidimicrobiia bacterium]|jgi:AcrR family transcriptional regulator
MAVIPDVDAAPVSDATARAVTATLACIARSGLAKLTVDDVAREAGASRATIYRAFPSRQALVAAAVASEADRICGAIADAVAAAVDLDDVVAQVVLVGTRELSACAALRFVAEHEADLLYPHLEFAGGDRLYAEVGRRLAPAFAGRCAEPERAAEWVARFALSLHWAPVPLVDPTDAAAVRRVVATYVTPGIAARVPVPS